MPSGLLADFQHEYEAARLEWLRRRFLLYTGVFGVLSLASAVLLLLAARREFAVENPEPWSLGGLLSALGAGACFIEAVVFLAPFARTVRASSVVSRDRLVAAASRIITITLLVQFLVAVPLAVALTELLRAIGTLAGDGRVGPLYPVLLMTLLIHFSAAALLPLTPREAIRPLVPFLTFYTVASLLAPIFFKGDSVGMLLYVLPMIASVGVPGVVTAWLRTSRFSETFTNRAVRERYSELSHELSTARRIHDSLFPLPVRDGPVRVEFAYEPMRQIGGDLLYARRHENGVLDVVLIDVTGHGIAAALAVNRLHGELNRVYGQRHAGDVPSPGAVISALNSYVFVTMAAEGFFATALCLRVDAAAGRLVYANAGHPPVIARRADGSGERLDSTAFMLGAIDSDAFDAGEAESRVSPGDVLVAYSDGATETTGRDGKMLGIDGLEAVVKRDASAEGIGGAVRAFRVGPPQDDVLIVTVECHYNGGMRVPSSL
jgi:hypothetical protein